MLPLGWQRQKQKCSLQIAECADCSSHFRAAAGYSQGRIYETQEHFVRYYGNRGACEVALCHGMGVLGSEESSLWLNPQGELARRRGGHRETGIYLAYIPSEASGMCSVLLFFPRVENRTQIAHGGRLSGTPPPPPPYQPELNHSLPPLLPEPVGKNQHYTCLVT